MRSYESGVDTKLVGMGPGGKKEWEIVETKEYKIADDKENLLSSISEDRPPKFTTEERNRMEKRKKHKNAQWSGERPAQVPKYKNKTGPTIRRQAA